MVWGKGVIVESFGSIIIFLILDSVPKYVFGWGGSGKSYKNKRASPE
jgi:TM2 domain-containing membrane protein YozV